MLYKNSNNNDNSKTNSNILNFMCICRTIATLVTIAYNVTYVYHHRHCRQRQHRHHRVYYTCHQGDGCHHHHYYYYFNIAAVKQGSLQKLNIYGNPDALSTTCKAPVKEKINDTIFTKYYKGGYCPEKYQKRFENITCFNFHKFFLDYSNN
uniref:Uncharacterized protein n=1 Tax=Glossina brevipalpis TaxID=37001 RepID=A0A1A9W394_9MUSC